MFNEKTTMAQLFTSTIFNVAYKILRGICLMKRQLWHNYLEVPYLILLAIIVLFSDCNYTYIWHSKKKPTMAHLLSCALLNVACYKLRHKYFEVP